MASTPRWKTVLSKVLSEHEKSTVIQLSTTDASGAPHVRSHVFRSFHESHSNLARPLLLSSTDIRTPKCAQLVSNPSVELAWWIEPTQEQFRISGRAALIPVPSHALHPSKQKNFEWAIKHVEFASVDWELQRRNMFNELSGHMKASWARPTPGTPLSKYPDSPPESWPERLPKLDDDSASEEDKVHLQRAFANFALLLIDPTDVDYVELGVVPNKRTHFWKEGKEWREDAVVP